MDFIVQHKFRVLGTGFLKKIISIQKKFPPFLSRFFRYGCHLWTQFSPLLIGQIEKFWFVSDREFPEFFKKTLTFISCPFQSGVIAKRPRKSVFFGTPCTLISEQTFPTTASPGLSLSLQNTTIQTRRRLQPSI